MHVYTHSETSLNSGCYIYTFIVCSQIYGSTHVPIIMYMLYVKSIFIFWNYCIRTVNQQVKLSLFSWTIYTYFHGTYISNFREGNFSNLTCLCKPSAHEHWHLACLHWKHSTKIDSFAFSFVDKNTINKIFMKPKRVQQVGPLSASTWCGFLIPVHV